MTTPASMYPRPVQELLPAARAIAVRLGEVPSRNLLMRELRVGSPKATALREALNREQQDQDGGQAESTGGHRGLHLVRDTTTDHPAEVDVPAPVDPSPEPSPVSVDPVPVAPSEESSGGSGADLPSPVAEDTERPLSPVAVDGHPDSKITPVDRRVGRSPVRSWVLLLLAAPAFVAIWSGWVGLGELTGFGVVHPLPGIWDSLAVNTAITLPIGVEAYAAYALRAWLAPDGVPPRARRFAAWSAIGSLVLGAAGQVAYHLMESAGITAAPWWITTVVACLPVAVLGMGAALAHLLHTDRQQREP
ncbi:ABC transporter permease [Solwaraspora sp. WMMA2080]|uniref:ABC transporter permease n=1 Tax=unclassified Solwaraspora TaxID=2627926 RepID=UPI00248CBD67|nr:MULTISPECIES: ABC transporter permease [unclassified Solwaraspora]WBB97280.1 ABC transporter permease [Solwaraspora sp. WMMA2059]WBC18818.1 ABC transporter permease [Solwaraspora sp. WMMA2080]